MKHITALFLVLACIVSGCAFESQELILDTETPVTTELPTIASSEPVSETAAESPTESVVNLVVAPGSYLEKYIDPNTADYLDYYLHIPANATESMPLFVFLHGDGEVGKPEYLNNYGPMLTARSLYGDEFPFIAIFPCTRTTSWVNGTIPDTLMGLIEHIAERFSADRDRIMLGGHSRGAIGVWHLISQYGDYFSCAVPVSCGAGTYMNYENCAKVPVRAMVGTIGDDIEYGWAMQYIVGVITECGGSAELIRLENCTHGQSCIAAFTEDTFEWMLSQGKEAGIP